MKSLIIAQLLNAAFSLWQPTLLEGPLTPEMKYFLTEAGAPDDVNNAAWRIGCAVVIAYYQDLASYNDEHHENAHSKLWQNRWDEYFRQEPLMCMEF
jgi:hypothetical protein